MLCRMDPIISGCWINILLFNISLTNLFILLNFIVKSEASQANFD